jgi:ketosteroid isomerase-like protein
VCAHWEFVVDDVDQSKRFQGKKTVREYLEATGSLQDDYKCAAQQEDEDEDCFRTKKVEERERRIELKECQQQPTI